MGPLMQQAQAQTSYLDSRADALRQVESTITELGGMFQQLAGMVQEQGEMALRIDENMDDTLANVEAAQGQLLKVGHSDVACERQMRARLPFGRGWGGAELVMSIRACSTSTQYRATGGSL